MGTTKGSATVWAFRFASLAFFLALFAGTTFASWGCIIDQPASGTTVYFTGDTGTLHLSGHAPTCGTITFDWSIPGETSPSDTVNHPCGNPGNPSTSETVQLSEGDYTVVLECSTGTETRTSDTRTVHMVKSVVMPQPDYTVEGISAPASAMVGDTFDVAINVKNTGGDSAAASTLRANLEGQNRNSAIPALGSGAGQPTTFSFSCDSNGTKTITATADADGNVAESDETDNTATASVECIEAGATSVCQSDKFSNVATLSAIAAIGMACVIALAYMFGEFTQNARVLTWAKAEAGQVVLSAAIVLVLLWSLSAMCTMRVGEVGKLAGIGSVPKVYDSTMKSALPLFSGAILYLENLAGAGLSNLATLRYNLGAYEIRTSYSKYTCDSICLFSLSSVNEATFGGETMHLAITNNLLGVGTASYLSVLFQYFTLIYIANGLFVQFLPLAIIVRSIPFMRQLGGALIAIFVALYILYPAMIVADAYIAPAFTHYTGPITTYDRGGGCRGLEDAFYSPSGGVDCLGGRPTEGSIQNTVTLWEAEDSLDDIKPGDLAQSVRLNVLIFLTAVFLPAVNFIVIAAFARDLSRFLGEEADITRLGQMV